MQLNCKAPLKLERDGQAELEGDGTRDAVQRVIIMKHRFYTRGGLSQISYLNYSVLVRLGGLILLWINLTSNEFIIIFLMIVHRIGY